MRMTVRMLSFALALFSVTATAAASAEALPCALGKLCSFTGKLAFFPYADGQSISLENADGCVALAVRSGRYRSLERWNGRRVTVRGIAYQQPSGRALLWYKIKGRRMSAGVCPNGPVIYVRDLTRVS
jgi:hypothetical protein